MEYNIKAIETKFKSFLFRSRLEAKWAAMFELLEWKWDYEPIDFNGWIPDFAIYGAKRTVYVEVKPIVEFSEELGQELDKSGCTDEMLIVGQRCLIESDYVSGAFGWGKQKQTQTDCDDFFYDDWDEAVFGRWSGKIGFCHCQGSFADRVSGKYNGSCGGDGLIEESYIKRLWAEAHNLTRWNKR